jgi:hypothetical protein
MNFDLENHRKEFPHTAVQIVEDRLAGIWMIGNMYKRVVGYHGEYPPGYVKRVYSLFPNRKSTLHLFSGSLVSGENEYTLDVNPENHPEVEGKAEEVEKYFPPDSFDLVLADPPYTSHDAEIYGYLLPNIPKVMRSLHEIVERGGIVVWLSTKPPMYRKDQWQLAGIVGLHCGTNRAFRSVIFMRAI